MHKKGMKDKVSQVIVGVADNNYTGKDHTLHEQEYNMRNDVSAIPDENTQRNTASAVLDGNTTKAARTSTSGKPGGTVRQNL